MHDYDEFEQGISVVGVMLAFVGGAIAGAATALLLAPQSGRETREQIRGMATTAKDKVARAPLAIKEASAGAKEKFVGAYKNAKENVGALR